MSEVAHFYGTLRTKCAQYLKNFRSLKVAGSKMNEKTWGIDLEYLHQGLLDIPMGGDQWRGSNSSFHDLLVS